VTRRAPLVVLLAASLFALAGCAARRERLGLDPEAYARPRATARPGQSGYASFGSAVRLREGTPSLTALEEEARRREPVYVEVPPWAEAPAGPAGDPGVACWYDPWAATNGWGVVSPGYAGGPVYGGPGYAAPGGAVPPGLRAPNPVTAPYHRAFPSGDVTYHRPGLSTGTGIYGRDARDAARGSQR
jgi:hypothetical protein